MLAANDAASNGPPDPEHALRELVGVGISPAAPAPERRHGPPCAAPQRAAPPPPPAVPIVPIAGSPVVAPHVAGPVAPPAVEVNPANVHHGQAVSRSGSLRYLQIIVKDHTFPRIKFPNPDEDLSFSNDPRSICRQIATLASVSDVDIEAWWNLTRKEVFEKIMQLRNNAIRLLGIAVDGNFVVSQCCSLRLHIVFSNTKFPPPPPQ